MPADRTEYFRQYRIKNKERQKEWRDCNKDRSADYRMKNDKYFKLHDWKRRGVKADLNYIYDKYIITKNCDFCKKELKPKCKCLEHNHYSGEVRGIVCSGCNKRMCNKDKRFQSVMKDLRKNL